MGKEEQIRLGLKKIAEKVGPQCSLLAQVKTVDEEAFTCDAYDSETEIVFTDLRLSPIIGGKTGLVLIPETDSWILAIRIEDTEDWQVIGVEEVKKVLITTGTVKVEQTSEGLLISKGNDTLKQCLTLIIEAVQKIVVIQGNNPDYSKLAEATQKLNAILK